MRGFLEWMQSNGWVVTAAGIVVAATIAISLYFKNKKRKTVDYSLLNDVRILSSRTAQLDGRIQVIVDGHEVVSPQLVTVRFVNTGNQEIVEDDFLDGLGLSTGEGVVSVKLVERSNDFIKVTERGVLPNIRFSVDCMNSGDYIDVQYLLDTKDLADEFLPNCRIKGSTRPMHDLQKARARRAIGFGVGLFAIVFTVLIFLLTFTGVSSSDWLPIVFTLFAFIPTFALTFSKDAIREFLQSSRKRSGG